MLKLFLNTTDNFLCSSVKNVFAKTETLYKEKNMQMNLLEELDSFKENPLGCTIGIKSKFETNIKLKIKLILGFFFVVVPLAVFTTFSYFTQMPLALAFIATFAVAILVASRMEEIAARYVQSRKLEFSKNHLH
ncbi:hypothetical protein [Sulfurimonas sp.]